MDAIQKSLLEQVAELHDVPEGAYNIRANGKAAARNTTAHIDIVSKTDSFVPRAMIMAISMRLSSPPDREASTSRSM